MYTEKNTNLDCSKELKWYENKIYESGSFPAEYYYLLGRSLKEKGHNEEARKYLQRARQDLISDNRVNKF